MRYMFMRFPEGKTKAVTFSYDDGCINDKRLCEIFDRYGMKATFNINSGFTGDWYLTHKELSGFLENGHELALHGDLHRAPGLISPAEYMSEIIDCKRKLENTYKRIIRGYAYPDSGITRWLSSNTYEKTVEILRDLGVSYARTLGGDNNSFTMPADRYSWVPTAHHNNEKLISWIDEFKTLDVNSQYIAARYPRLMYIWGHSFEFENDNNWDRIESICASLGGKDDIWYASNIEIMDYADAYSSLVFSSDRAIIYNPTLVKLYFNIDGTDHEIGSGETLYLK